MDINHAACYRFYDKDGRRLAVFSRFLDPETAEIYILPCSKDELFKKKFAKTAYLQYLESNALEYNAVVETVKIQPEEGTLKTLFRYAYENLYYPVLKAKLINKTTYKRLKNG